VASGKSTVAAILAELGCVVVDADLLAREVVAPGTEGLLRIVGEFGPEVLDDRGELERPAMAATVFADQEARQRLEAIVHPLVRARAAAIEAEAPTGSVIVHDIPLLVETGQDASFDAVLVLDVPVEIQVERMVAERGLSRAEASARVSAQATRERRREVATYVIDNTGTRENLRDRVTEVFDALVSAGGTA